MCGRTHLWRCAWVIGLVCGAAAAESPSLERGVPADVQLLVRRWHNPKRQFISEHYATVWRAFKNSGIDREVVKLMQLDAGEAAEAAQQAWKTTSQLISGVEWAGLVGNDVAAMVRVKLPAPEVLIVCRDNPDKVAQNMKGLRAILEFIVSKNESLRLSQEKIGSVDAVRLTAEGAPVGLILARDESLILASTSAELVGEYLDLLKGKSQKARLIDHAAYKEAFARLPKAEESLSYVDVHGLLFGLRDLLIHYIAEDAETDPGAPKIAEVINKLVARLDLIGAVAETQRTEGRATVSEQYMAMLPEAEKSPLYAVLWKQRAFDKFDRFVPQEASSFNLVSGIDWTALYRVVLDFIEKDVPDGATAVAELRDWQTQVGFSIEDDLLSWIGGDVIVVSMANPVPNALGMDSSVVMIGLKDVPKARSRMERAIKALADFTQQRDQPLLMQPADVGEPGFTSVSHPIMSAFAIPVYGFYDRFLVFGTSEDAVAKVLEVGKGQAPSVVANPRFKKLGIAPDGPVVAASFSDLSQLGAQLARFTGMYGMISAFMPAEASKDASAAILAILGRIAPVLSKINFLDSSGSVTVRKDNGFHVKSVTQYKEPRPAATTQPQ